jgi:hypothetical protein
LKEQRAKMGGGAPPSDGGEGEGGEERAQVDAVAVAAPVTGGGLTLEGGAEFEEGDEPNFNRVDAPQPSSAGDRGGDRPRGGGGRPGGGGGGGGRRRGRRDGGRGGRGGHSGGGHGGGGGRH